MYGLMKFNVLPTLSIKGRTKKKKTPKDIKANMISDFTHFCMKCFWNIYGTDVSACLY